MKLTPRYGSKPVIRLDGDPSAIGALVVRQRRRFADALAVLNDEQWDHPSRCEGWSSKDVAVHLGTVNAFWELSVQSGIAGQPTEFLANFDPVVTPQQMVTAAQTSADEIVDTIVASAESLATCVAAMAPADWTMLAESPPGHVSVSAVLHHALWDAWIHERDVLLPLGMSPTEDADEIRACLRYVAALTPALALTAGCRETGAFDVVVTDPDVSLHVEIGRDVEVADGTAGANHVLTGSAVDLLEALSFRRPFGSDIPDEIAWAFTGLGAAFDQ